MSLQVTSLQVLGDPGLWHHKVPSCHTICPGAPHPAQGVYLRDCACCFLSSGRRGCCCGFAPLGLLPCRAARRRSVLVEGMGFPRNHLSRGCAGRMPPGWGCTRSSCTRLHSPRGQEQVRSNPTSHEKRQKTLSAFALCKSNAHILTPGCC